MKLSDNPEKVTNPGEKALYRLYNRTTGKVEADLITLVHEVIDDSQPLTIFDPLHTWKRKTLTDFRAVPLLEPIFKGGKSSYRKRDIEETRAFCFSQLDSLWDSLKRFENPQEYYVDLSQDLWTLKDNFLHGGVCGQE